MMNCSKNEKNAKTLSPPDESRDAHNFPRSPRPASMSAEAGEGGIFTRTRKRARSEPPRGAEVGARERLPVERVDVPTRGFEGIRRNLRCRRETACAFRTREP